MKVEILNKKEIEYITGRYTLEDIEESTAEEVTNYLWLSYTSYMTLGEAQQRVKEIISKQKEYDSRSKVEPTASIEICSAGVTLEESEKIFNDLYEQITDSLKESKYDYSVKNIEFDYEYDDIEEPNNHMCKAKFELKERDMQKM